MTAPTLAAAYDWLGIPLLTPTGPYCGGCGGRRAGARHADVAAIRACDAYRRDQDAVVEGARWAEAAYERHLEDRGYDEARAQEDYEARNGVIGFIEAWHIQSPHTCPCEEHWGRKA